MEESGAEPANQLGVKLAAAVGSGGVDAADNAAESSGAAAVRAVANEGLVAMGSEREREAAEGDEEADVFEEAME